MLAGKQPIDPEQLEFGSRIYSHKGGRPFVVMGFCKYALDCSVTMVKFVNVEDTDDTPAGQEWVLDLSTVLKMFVEDER